MGATVCDGIVALARVVGAVRGHRAEFNISRDLVGVECRRGQDRIIRRFGGAFS